MTIIAHIFQFPVPMTTC